MNKLYRNLRYDWPLHFVLMVTNWLPDNIFFLWVRGYLASFFFKQCGNNLRLGRRVTFYNPSNIKIANNVYVALGCWFLGAEEIVIGNEVMFGPYCVISDANHTLLNGSFRYGAPVTGRIIIDEGSWIGAHSSILMNVHIGKGVLVAANSVVNKSIMDFQIVGGIPARKLKD